MGGYLLQARHNSARLCFSLRSRRGAPRALSPARQTPVRASRPTVVPSPVSRSRRSTNSRWATTFHRIAAPGSLGARVGPLRPGAAAERREGLRRRCRCNGRGLLLAPGLVSQFLQARAAALQRRGPHRAGGPGPTAAQHRDGLAGELQGRRGRLRRRQAPVGPEFGWRAIGRSKVPSQRRWARTASAKAAATSSATSTMIATMAAAATVHEGAKTAATAITAASTWR